MVKLKKGPKKPVVVAVSGYFNPLHVGHLEMIERAKKLGDKLVVIVNNDRQVALKGRVPFMPEADRVKIIKALHDVDEVILAIDDYKWPNGEIPVIKSLAKVKPDIFANGGDRLNIVNVPEFDICQKLNIKLVDGLGKKIRASSEIIARAARRKIQRARRTAKAVKKFMKKTLSLIGALALVVAAALAGFYYIHRHQAPVYKLILRAEKTIKIPEGLTNKDIASYLAKTGPWTSADFLRIVGSAQAHISASTATASPDFVRQYDFLADRPQGASLEGYLFPDTYRVYASSTVADIAAKMLANFDAKLTPQLRADIKSQGKTIYDILIMASIIEKEAAINYQTKDNHDAKIISGIFWRRLRAGQALQSDATLSYILQDNKAQHSGADLTIDSPYNTYKYQGLPPGPIGNPGLLAIEAAIYPIASQYNYFLTTNEGVVVYAQTYAEHLQNKYKYLP
jgi:uncharacterized YceG family protein